MQVQVTLYTLVGLLCQLGLLVLELQRVKPAVVDLVSMKYCVSEIWFLEHRNIFSDVELEIMNTSNRIIIFSRLSDYQTVLRATIKNDSL